MTLKSTLPSKPSAFTLCASMMATLLSPTVLADEAPLADIEHLVVTSEKMDSPTEVLLDPKQPRQPLPAHDGADFLKTIPGFNLVRKGGASSDPMFRGMAASRLTILNDGNLLFGGCSSRMDPPTAYLSPQSFDQIRVIKGPQSVLYLPANATVLFERESHQLQEGGLSGDASLTVASFGRREGNTDLTLGNQQGYLRLLASHAESDNYKDGDSNEVNSRYQRWSVNSELAWTPDDKTLLMLSLGQSDGEAAYADRAMDGSLFDRRQVSLKARRDDITPWLNRLEGQWYFNHVDHVMDNFSLRDFTPSIMMPNPSAMNPDRYTRGGRIQADIQIDALILKTGLDTSANTHRIRMSMNQIMMPYEDMLLMEDGRFEQWGLFAEARYPLSDNLAINGGWRVDNWQAEDHRQKLAKTMTIKVDNPTFGETRDENLHSGFMRLEYQQGQQTWYAGLGRAERFPDYWELIGNARSSENSPSAFFTDTEVTTQIDFGWLGRFEAWQVDLSGYYGKVDDFILLDKQNPMLPETVRNIDARIWGGEALVAYQVENLKLETSLSYSRGENKTDDLPLAQQPPLELKFSAGYQLGNWQLGALWRLVDRQNRVASGQGSIAGLDTTPTAGFGILSINAAWQANTPWRVSLGIDNLLDRAYQEYLSKGAANIPGYVAEDRINEPGRTLWAKVDYRFD
ncbi:TonB-dependent copper receptor [Aliiglaciecola sp. CAU 1673]|uniref:TonB-dependent copper receptor n=1 Tax=Aliiglaciecola sp. CAU 1673 TaxID=3032595 RepID=UPI0023DC404E|nr:TonB-dependent copper receptor [Aliiglaciecola sp. CAU 1673]MDF2178879.1 TonB-dependent copper receptor [Aliiglaciecola sp. CAU 1673]